MQVLISGGYLRPTAAPLEAVVGQDHFLAMNRFSLLARFLTFRKELATLWQAFVSSETPIHLKALMLLVPAYLLSPIDLIPDMIPLLGWVDDFIVVPLLVSWIVRMLPQQAPVYRRTADGAKEIDGTYRRR